MEMPSVKHVMRDDARNIEYVVLAYRTLTRDEVIQAIAMARRSKKALKKNSRIEIISTHGIEDSRNLRA